MALNANAASSVQVASTQGALSRVVLAKFVAAGAKDSPQPPNGADGGFLLEFDILPSKDAPAAPFTLSELRDVQIDGKSYSALTRAALGRPFEPHTDVNKLDPRAANRVSKDRQAQAVTMRVILWGIQPPRSGVCQIRLDVGWGEKTERLDFNVAMSKLQRTR